MSTSRLPEHEWLDTPARGIMALMTTKFGIDAQRDSHGARFAAKFPLFMRAVVVGLWIEGAFIAFLGISRPLSANELGSDSHAYWLAGQGNAVYDKAPGQVDAFLYSPVFTAAVQPLALLPWPLFLAVWICLQGAVLFWLLMPLKIKWAVPIFLICVPELVNGNIYILLAAAAVLGVCHPAVWVFPMLTKVSVGVGLLWFVVLGEWKRVAQGAGVLALVVGVSYVLSPGQWNAWLDFLVANRSGTRDGSVSFLLRCAGAVALIVIGARKQWPWLMAPALVLASPALAVTTLAVLTAIPRLLQRRTRESQANALRSRTASGHA